MALFRITVNRTVDLCGERLERGMSVEVACSGLFVSDPLGYQGGQRVVDAFMRMYGIDISRGIGSLRNYVTVQKLG